MSAAKPHGPDDLERARILTPYVASYRLGRGRSVLDLGCGPGYGTWLMAANGAERVVGVDRAAAKARQAERLCAGLRGCAVLVADAQRLPFAARSFGMVTCFEVIEHVPEPERLLAELRRVLTADGVLLLTTPNRSVRLLPLQRPRNPDHLREYSSRALAQGLRERFPSIRVLGIYGQPEAQAYYRRRWRPRLGRAVRDWLRSRGGSRTAPPLGCGRADSEGPSWQPPPAPDPSSWPFHVGAASRRCLNLFAVCGLQDRPVHLAAQAISPEGVRNVGDTP